MGKEKILIGLIILLGLGLRLYGSSQSFWLDEASQAQLSSLPLSQIWSGRAGDFHPPLFYFLAHVWLQVGRAEVWLRLLPVGIGIIGIWLMGQVARGVLPKTQIKLGRWTFSGAQAAMFLLAINPFHIYYSQEFRMYSLVATLGIWAMYLFLRRSRWLWLILAAMLYTHYSTFLLLPTLLVYSWIFDRKNLTFSIWQLVLALVSYLPWYPQLARQLAGGVNIDEYLPGWRELLTLGPITSIPVTLFKLVAGRINFLSRVFYAIYMVYILAVVVVGVILARVQRWLLVFWLFFPLAMSILVSFVIPMTQPFRLIFILPALMLIFTQGVIRFPRLMLLLIIYISVTGVVMYATRPRLQREQWRHAAQYLTSVDEPDSITVIKFSGNFAPLAWYAPNLEVLAAIPTYPAKKAEVSKRLAVTQPPRTVYLVQYLGELTDPYRVVEEQLAEEGYQEEGEVNFEGVGLIHKYQRP